MRAEHGRWAFVRLSLVCPRCDAETVQRVPERATPCIACHVPIEVTDFARIAAETDTPLDRLAWGATRATPRLVVGRQQPLCWQCGVPVPLSAADIGAQHTIYCRECDARTQTWPAPEWLRMHLPDALQIYAAPATGTAADPEPIWMRCAACEAGFRIDAESTRLTRCGACLAKNHVPDTIWQALHPVRHGAPWFVLFEQISAAERAARMQAKTVLGETLAAVGQPDRDVLATIDLLRRDGSQASEDALFSALRTPSRAWFDAALAALVTLTALTTLVGPRIAARLVEALDAETDPARQLAIARAIEPTRADATLAACARLADRAPSVIAAEALAIWARLEPARALAKATSLVVDAPLQVRRQAARLLIEHAQSPLSPAAAALLDHADSRVQRNAVRLIAATTQRSAAAALRGLLALSVAAEVSAALRGVDGLHAGAALQVARKAQGEQRVTATRWAIAAGAIPQLQQLADDLAHHEGAVAQALCDALLAQPSEARSTALCALLEGPTLKVRLDAAELLERHGEAQALTLLDELAGRWFTNRALKRAAEKAATAIRWRSSQNERGGLTVHEVGGLSDAE